MQEAEAVIVPDEDAASNKKTKTPEPVHVTTMEVVGFDDDGEAFVKGEPQPPAYKDIWFSRAFYLHLVGVIVTAIVYIPSVFIDTDSNNEEKEGTWSTKSTTDSTFDNSTMVIPLVVILAVLMGGSMVVTLSLIIVMTNHSEKVIYLSFVAAPALLMAWAVVFAVLGGTEGLELGIHFGFYALFFAAISACVYRAYKSKIPFAASTLQAALEALQVNRGLIFLSMGSLALAFSWSGLWITTMMGIFAAADAKGKVSCLDLYPTETDVYNRSDMCDVHPPNVLAIMFLILSFYWTHQVIKNCMHCTTAGTVGSWWFNGFGDPSLCSGDVSDSLSRTLTFSFGSICFGSLVVAILQLLENMARSARRNRNGQLLACLLECILACVRQWVEYFNSWAFVYVALYGYDYRTAGKNVMTLFKNRGWSSFVADRLVFRVLYSTNLVVGIFCGGIAAGADLIIGPIFPADNTSGEPNFNPAEGSHITCFYIGALVGLVTSSVALFVMESAVRAVIVCFAESPAEIQEHHPHLCELMRNGWAAAYPDIWNEGDYEERFVKATVISYDEEVHPAYTDDPLHSKSST